ncbi:putative acyltransferase [Terriglobus roseus DSM 18391]|uniref:Putative acyltransferase n=1 Tax=Terriglobus roseus (strain DSM 18391 / NRRL B-41598 / KBS 63) TaxID=926566 RepID=I3ZLJ4_TERRK|nr:acyltransferase [Terriglobus roseus]AFL90112.1 putative acyltransferase [Terriglobus roseus DSM 18391]
MSQPDTRIQPKQHFEILDGLRGVAAMMVVIFHVCETWNGGDHARQIINHGYLAVDFFFMLSGFVVAYAYDDRWQPANGRQRMTLWDFFKRRIIRLQPMVIMGNLLGALLFYLSASPKIFPLVATTPVSRLILITLIGCTVIPIPISMDIRGWQEMHPLAGTAWSLFFEYIANIAYALGLRRASNRVLVVFAALSAAALTHYLVTTPRGDITGGWSVNAMELKVGFLRLLYPFLAGMLVQRMHKRLHVRNAFLWCSLLLVLTFALPRFGTPATLWKNGLYEALIIILVYPVIVAMGAGEQINGRTATRLCRFSGAISYPLYITHYALIYIYTAKVYDGKLTPAQGVGWGVALFFTSIAIAYACLKLYDEPLRRWLNKRFLLTGVTTT